MGSEVHESPWRHSLVMKHEGWSHGMWRHRAPTPFAAILMAGCLLSSVYAIVSSLSCKCNIILDYLLSGSYFAMRRHFPFSHSVRLWWGICWLFYRWILEWCIHWRPPDYPYLELNNCAIWPLIMMAKFSGNRPHLWCVGDDGGFLPFTFPSHSDTFMDSSL